MQSKIKTVASLALGCKVNQYESEAAARLFAENGYEISDGESAADVYIINTCAVTNFGDKKSRQLIRKVKKLNPNAVVAVTGCYAQTAAEEVAKVEGVNMILGTKDRRSVLNCVENYKPEYGVVNFVSDIRGKLDFEELPALGGEERARAYLKIQDGCDRFCAYCIIPYARGAVRSRPLQNILREAETLAQKGFKEIVLTGIHVASYGKDLKDVSLIDVIERVCETEGVERIRLSSVEPIIITEEFMQRLAAMPKVCPHFHLSLQSGCDKILKAMNRRYDTEGYERAVETIRRHMPYAGLTTDVIVGFPGETEEDFAQTCAFVEKIGFSKIHVFPYSPKRGTPAAVMPNQIKNAVKSERSGRLIAIGDKLGERFALSFKGKPLEVLFERKLENGFYEGHTPNYIRVLAKSDDNLTNKIVAAQITGVEKDDVFSEILK